jgi:predicted peptidase
MSSIRSSASCGLVIAGLILCSATASAKQRESGFLNRVLADADGQRRFQVFVPSDYSADRRWPVILFLHGGGEQGNDGMLQTEVGLGSAIRRQPGNWPAIVVFPQVRPGRRWNAQDAAWAMKALEHTQREFATDPARVYLVGMSRGGAGAYYLAYRHPGIFAAALVVCGRVTPAATLDGQPAPDTDPVVQNDGDRFAALATRMKSLPVWVFHGDADPVVPVGESRQLVAALRNLGAPVTYTELPGIGHNSWDPAFRNPEVPQWLLGQKLQR